MNLNQCRKVNSATHGLSETIVGVLGGGQLGRMLCQAASQMAIKVNILDPMKNCPASFISHHHMVGSFNDSTTVEEFAKSCGILTVEIEHVDTDTLEKLEKQGVDCQPKASTIRIIQVLYCYTLDFKFKCQPKVDSDYKIINSFVFRFVVFPPFLLSYWIVIQIIVSLTLNILFSQDKFLQKVHFSQNNIPLPKFMQVWIINEYFMHISFTPKNKKFSGTDK